MQRARKAENEGQANGTASPAKKKQRLSPLRCKSLCQLVALLVTSPQSSDCNGAKSQLLEAVADSAVSCTIKQVTVAELLQFDLLDNLSVVLMLPLSEGM